jgi:hypothetical protein
MPIRISFVMTVAAVADIPETGPKFQLHSTTGDHAERVQGDHLVVSQVYTTRLHNTDYRSRTADFRPKTSPKNHFESISPGENCDLH